MNMQNALLLMFADMDKAFAAMTNFEPQNESRYLVRNFLVQFDAIFTLNQDLLLVVGDGRPYAGLMAAS